MSRANVRQPVPERKSTLRCHSIPVPATTPTGTTTGPHSPFFLAEIDENVCASPRTSSLDYGHRQGGVVSANTWPRAGRGKAQSTSATQRELSTAASSTLQQQQQQHPGRPPSSTAATCRPSAVEGTRCGREECPVVCAALPLTRPASPSIVPSFTSTLAASLPALVDSSELRFCDEACSCGKASTTMAVCTPHPVPSSFADRRRHTQLASSLLPVRRDVLTCGFPMLAAHATATAAAAVTSSLPFPSSPAFCALEDRPANYAITPAVEKKGALLTPAMAAVRFPSSSFFASVASVEHLAASLPSPNPCHAPSSPEGPFMLAPPLPMALSTAWGTVSWQRLRGFTRFERAVQGGGRRWCGSRDGAPVSRSSCDLVSSSCEKTDASAPTPRKAMWSPAKPPAHGQTWGDFHSIDAAAATGAVEEAAVLWAAERMCDDGEMVPEMAVVCGDE